MLHENDPQNPTRGRRGDRQSITILKNGREVMRRGSRLLVIERVVPERSRRRPSSSTLICWSSQEDSNEPRGSIRRFSKRPGLS
jgi:hypothetical protein